MTYAYTWKTIIGMVRICRENDGWYLYIDQRKWQGPFAVADMAADYATFATLKPEEMGVAEVPPSLGVSDKLSDWMKIPG